jgi:hypothetical protein
VSRRVGSFVMPGAARYPEPRARIPRVARNDKNRLLLPLLLALLLGACGGSTAPASTPAPASAAKPASSPSVSAGASAGAAAAVRKEGPSLSFKFAVLGA